VIEQYLQAAQPYIEHYGYAAVFGLIFVEGFGIPAPGETVLIGAAVLAGEGRMDPAVVLATAWLAAVSGDNLGFVIGHFGGRRLALTWGRRFGVNENHLHRVERFFARYGGAVVMFARFFEGLRQLNGVVAGTAGMGWWRFLTYNGIGAGLWVGLWGGGAYVLGNHLEQVLALMNRFEPYVIAAAAAAVIVVAVYVLKRSRTD